MGASLVDYRVIVYLLCTGCSFAVVLNIVLFFVAKRESRHMGFFKYLLMGFAVLEGSYAIMNIMTVPIVYSYGGYTIILSHGGLLSVTPLASFGVSFYCIFFELWVCYIALMFVYKYITLCRENLSERIKYNPTLKLICVFICGLVFGYYVVCGSYFCTRHEISKPAQQVLKERFGLDPDLDFGYFAFSLLYPNGDFSVFGFLSIFDHLILCILSAVIVFYCGTRMWRTINNVTEGISQRGLQKQLFLVICSQAVIPLVTYQIPASILVVYSMFYEEDTKFQDFTILISAITSVPKVLDPLIVLLVIKDYRDALVRLFRHSFRSLSEFRMFPTSNSYSTAGSVSPLEIRVKTI